LNAFRKIRLWLGFSKACARCGKNSEAQLALKQALALDPHNVQCKSALEQLADLSMGKFERLVNGPLKDIMELVPHVKLRKDLAASKLQALVRGKRTRKDLEIGHSNSKHLRRRLVSSVAVRLVHFPSPIHKKIKFCSLLLKFRSDWNFAVKEVQVLETLSGDFMISKLSRPALAPCRVAGKPRLYSLNCEIVETNHTTQESSLRFSKDIKVTYKENASNLYHSQVFEIGLSPESSDEKESLIHRIVIQRKPMASVTTDDHTYFVSKGSVLFNKCHYLYSIKNTEKNSFISIYQLKSDQKFQFCFKREYFDLTFSVRKIILSLLNFLNGYSRYSKLVSSHDNNELLLNLPFETSQQELTRSRAATDSTPDTTVPIQQESFRALLGRAENPRQVYNSFRLLYFSIVLFI